MHLGQVPSVEPTCSVVSALSVFQTLHSRKSSKSSTLDFALDSSTLERAAACPPGERHERGRAAAMPKRPPKDRLIFPSALRNARKAAGFHTQKAFAKKCGAHLFSVDQDDRGVYPLSVHKAPPLRG